MNSFLRKLKREGIVKQDEAAGLPSPSVAKPGSAAVVSGVAQLPVDVFQSDQSITIYAQIPGLNLDKLDISIEGDNDVVTIQGEYKRPEEVSSEHHEGSGEFSLEECTWGQCFRQIILPQEIDSESADAKVKDGVLILNLPLKNSSGKKIKMRVTKIGDEHKMEEKHAEAVHV
ncbi:MAG: Hsp20/alpha crystallin family protein [Parcubacteria group bacterium]|nr:Hsp20/alpha crystallin family protein [Parcubacteria group bacterium]